MNNSSKSYLFIDTEPVDFIENLSEVNFLKVNSCEIDDFKIYNESNCVYEKSCGHIFIEYKGIYKCLYIEFYKNCLNYEIDLNNYVSGLDIIKSKISNFGNLKCYIKIYLGMDDLSIDLIEEILKSFGGGILIRDEECDKCIYIEDSLSLNSNIIYNDLSVVPDVLLNKFIDYYLTKNTLQKVNNKLIKKIKGSELFKEFTLRNLYNKTSIESELNLEISNLSNCNKSSYNKVDLDDILPSKDILFELDNSVLLKSI